MILPSLRSLIAAIRITGFARIAIFRTLTPRSEIVVSTAPFPLAQNMTIWMCKAKDCKFQIALPLGENDPIGQSFSVWHVYNVHREVWEKVIGDKPPDDPVMNLGCDVSERRKASCHLPLGYRMVLSYLRRRYKYKGQYRV